MLTAHSSIASTLMVPMISCLSLPWVQLLFRYLLSLNEHYLSKMLIFAIKKLVFATCPYLAKTYISGSGAASAISVFEDRYKPNMEVRQLFIDILIDIF